MARGLRIAACEFPSWKWKTAGVSCSSSGRGLHARDGGELIPGIERAVITTADLLHQCGGVVPKLAQDAHAQAIDKVVAEALGNAGVQERDLSAVAVTIGPGLRMSTSGREQGKGNSSGPSPPTGWRSSH